jgi:hypothetical protein
MQEFSAQHPKSKVHPGNFGDHDELKRQESGVLSVAIQFLASFVLIHGFIRFG